MGWNRDDGIERPCVEFEADAAEIASEPDDERRLRGESEEEEEEVDD